MLDTTSSNQQQVPKKINKQTYFYVSILLMFILEYFTRDYLYSVLTPKTAIYLQSTFPYLTIPCRIFSFFATENGIVLIIVLLFNFVNIYITFLLMLCALLSVFLGGTWKLLYQHPRPFITHNQIQAWSCEGGWGNPSNHALLSTCFYLSLLHLLFKKDSKQYSPYKIITITGITLICFSRLFLGMHSINQILFGAFLGYSLYFLLFKLHIIHREINAYQLIQWILKYTNFIFIIVSLISLGVFLYIVIPFNYTNINAWWGILFTHCPNYPLVKTFENDALTCILALSILIACIIGINYEYKVLFKESYIKWSKFNFDSCNENENLLLDPRNVLGNNIESNWISYRWNNTDLGKSIKRLLIISWCCWVIIWPRAFIGYDNHIWVVLCFKIFAPIFWVSFLMFSYLKQITGKCGSNSEILLDSTFDERNGLLNMIGRRGVQEFEMEEL